MITRAYDAAAADYDERVAGDAWMRSALWERYARLFGPTQTVLDVGSGTGIDALFLARNGVRVLAIDVSPSMISQARVKLMNARLDDLVELRVMDVSELGALPESSFDGIVSAFASLSTVADLDGFATEAARLLKPQGTLLIHLLNRWSVWEWLGLVRNGRFLAIRHLGRDVSRNFNIGGRSVRHYLYHAHEAYGRFFAARFRLRGAYGLGILRPPHSLRRIPPAVVSSLDRLERPLRARRPFIDWGRFFVLELEKR
jgi:SAM-dependent methyltransferase